MITIPRIFIHDIDAVETRAVPMPEAGPEEVIVRVSHCGICGSDLGYIHSGGLFGPGTPMALGHEFSGTVHASGAGVSGFETGQRVVVNPEAAGNGIGGLSMSEGAFSSYVRVKHVNAQPAPLLLLPTEISDEAGAMVEPLSVGLHALRRLQVDADDRVVIFGAGMIGLGMVLLCKALYRHPPVVVDINPKRLARARQLGADTSVGGDTLAEDLIRFHGSCDVTGSACPASEIYVEATGSAGAFDAIVNTATRGARIGIVGVQKAPVAVDLVNLLYRELSLVGSMAYSDEFPSVIEMMHSGQLDATHLITHRFALSNFDKALAQALRQDEAIKVMVDCQN